MAHLTDGAEPATTPRIRRVTRRTAVLARLHCRRPARRPRMAAGAAFHQIPADNPDQLRHFRRLFAEPSRPLVVHGFTALDALWGHLLNDGQR